MKPRYLTLLGILLSVMLSTGTEITIERQDTGVRLSGRTDLPRVVGAGARMELQLSSDLKEWLPLTNSVTVTEDGQVEWTLSGEIRNVFFRVIAEAAAVEAKDAGAEALGYGPVFRRALSHIGPIAPEELTRLYPPVSNYLLLIDWDPTDAEFWAEFNTDPAIYNAALLPGDPERRYSDFRLNPQELAVFKKNAFVVSERLGAHSFAESFYRIFIDDLPVFVSTDAILQAWHRTYDSMLQEIEEVFLSPAMEQMLMGMAAELPSLRHKFGSAHLADAFLDADYFITVARSLLREEQIQSSFGQESRVGGTLDAIQNLTPNYTFELFGACRRMDFSQFKPRGHYENSTELRRYFRAMMWCGRTDLRISRGTSDSLCPSGDPGRELAGAIVMNEALKLSGAFPLWRAFDRVLQVFMGSADSMNFAQLDALLAAAGIGSLAGIPNRAALEGIQEAILAGDLGVQEISADLYLSPLGTNQVRLPKSFAFMGQRFVPDSWAFGQCVYDSVLWRETETNAWRKVHRRIPSALDIGFSVLGNNATGPLVVERIRSGTEPFRDRQPYQHHLAAVRATIDQQGPETWESTIYMQWLATLKTLSTPTVDPRYPAAMRTKAWAMKSLNTQLASWTQLRHDTILYAKQSYTRFTLCSYPAGYVEPVPEFWAALTKMAENAAAFLASLTMDGKAQITTSSTSALIDRALVQSNQVQFLRNFAQTVRTLETLARKELAREAFTPDEEGFLKDLIEKRFEYDGIRQYTGWYPKLFYKNAGQDGYFFQTINGADRWDAIVADVHSDPPDFESGDPGGILHQAVGNVHLLMIAVETCDKPMVFAGPVLSHYEFKEPWPQRRSDLEWKRQILDGKMPPHPEWTSSHLVPGKLVIPQTLAYE